MTSRVTPAEPRQLDVRIPSDVQYIEAIVEQVVLAAAGGRLVEGDALPSVRALAERLVINPNTVARAYLELEREGILIMRQGFGTTVGLVKTLLPRHEKLRLLAEPADVLLTHAHHLDVGLDEVITVLRERDAAMQPESPQ